MKKLQTSSNTCFCKKCLAADLFNLAGDWMGMGGTILGPPMLTDSVPTKNRFP